MAELENEMQHQGVKAWVEKSKKIRYELVSVEILGSIARACLDVVPGLCGTKNRLGKVFLCWQFTLDWPDEKDAFFLAEISLGPAVNATGGRILERKIYVLIKGTPNGQQFTSAFSHRVSRFLSRGIPLDVFRVSDNDLVLSATLEIRRLRATIDVQTVDALLMEANEGCYAVPGVILADLLDTDHPSVTFEFSFYRRKRTPTTTSSTTPPARAPSETKKRKRPMKRSAQDSDSDTQYQSQRRRRREGSVIDIRSPDSKPALADDEEEREDHLAILEELERQEIELEQEAARKIQEKRDRIKKLKKALAK